MMDEQPFEFHDLLPLGADGTPYREIGDAEGAGVKAVPFGEGEILQIPPEALTTLAAEAFRDVNHYLRPGHLQHVRGILDDPEASDNDRFVAWDMLKNANIAAGGVLPMCQDTGTAIVMGKKGQAVWTGGGDEEALARGIHRTYTETNLRYSQVSPLSMFEEVNTRTNLPAQIELYATGGNTYEFLFIAKGGGSANKSFLFQETPARLNRDAMLSFLDEKIRTLGTTACPPYHLAIVIGGPSAEFTMKTVKLASCRYLDALPREGGDRGQAFRDLALEEDVLELTRRMGIGAQFGGKYFCYDVRVIRLPRHGASLPIGLGVSCAADRQILGRISRDGVFLERLETNPAQYLPEIGDENLGGAVVEIDLDRPMPEILGTLTRHPVKTRLALNGTMIVARDLAHARIQRQIEEGGDLPGYFRDHPVYYAGPAKTPKGYATGSFGPTTAGRMDAYVERFQALGGSMVMLAKGNRSDAVRKACMQHGGFYLGSVGGPGARLALDCIRKVECIAFEDLGMEAVWRIEVENFPAFIVIDDKGHDFFREL